MTHLNVAIAAEHGDDIEVLVKLCNKILLPINYRIKVNQKNRLIYSTQILKKDIVFIKKQFNDPNKPLPDLLIVSTDQDNDNDFKSKLYSEVARTGFPFPVILAIPIKTIENWLIADIAAINVALKASIKDVPKQDKSFNAKKWLGEQKGLYRPEMDHKKLCVRIAELMGVNKMENGFEEFKNDLLRVAQKLTAPERIKIQKGGITRKARRQFYKLLHFWKS
jgi:hypothetical protein